MKKSSSNTDMEQIFVQLSQIKSVLPPVGLFSKTMRRVNEQVSYFWVAAVASVLFGFLGMEFYLTLRKFQATGSELTKVIYTTNNMLYNE